MQIEDLKPIWKQYSRTQFENSSLSGNEINFLLSGGAINILSKIRRNIKIGFAILLLLIVDGLLNFVPSIKQSAHIYSGYIILNSVVVVFYFGVFSYFYLSFKRLNRKDIITKSLKEKLEYTIASLQSYKKLTYYGIAVLIFGFSFNITSGIYISYLNGNFSGEESFPNSIVGQSAIFISLSIVITLLVIFAACVLVNRILKRIYGEHLEQFKNDLAELIATE